VPFAVIVADAWFRDCRHERATMPPELLERFQVLSGVMPGHGLPGEPGGDEAPPDDESGDEEPEGDPS
jgi:hypothetical protein